MHSDNQRQSDKVASSDSVLQVPSTESDGQDLGMVGARKVGPGYERDVMHVGFVYLAELRSGRDDPSLTLLPPPFHQP